MIDDWMTFIPAGDAQLRDDRKQIRWRVSVGPFLLSKYPITQEVYEHVMGFNPATFKGPNQPVESVSWFDAILFCNALSQSNGLEPRYIISGNDVVDLEQSNGYRLPTDAEWEYACRANTGAVQYGVLEDIAWYSANAGDSTHEVGLKQPNGFGLYDMLGNVWEWCWDLYDPDVYGSYRVFRGGGWADQSRGCLASNRRRSHPTYAIDDLGFRVARSI